MNKAIFKTKFMHDVERNGQEVEIIYVKDTRDGKRYDIRFPDGSIIENAYESELDFE